MSRTWTVATLVVYSVGYLATRLPAPGLDALLTTLAAWLAGAALSGASLFRRSPPWVRPAAIGISLGMLAVPESLEALGGVIPAAAVAATALVHAYALSSVFEPQVSAAPDKRPRKSWRSLGLPAAVAAVPAVALSAFLWLGPDSWIRNHEAHGVVGPLAGAAMVAGVLLVVAGVREWIQERRASSADGGHL